MSTSDGLLRLLADNGPADFYAALRWPEWRDDVARLTYGDGLAAYPFLWSEQAQADPAAIRRRAVPMSELLSLSVEFAQQVTNTDPGHLGVVSAVQPTNPPHSDLQGTGTT